MHRLPSCLPVAALLCFAYRSCLKLRLNCATPCTPPACPVDRPWVERRRLGHACHHAACGRRLLRPLPGRQPGAWLRRDGLAAQPACVRRLWGFEHRAACGTGLWLAEARPLVVHECRPASLALTCLCSRASPPLTPLPLYRQGISVLGMDPAAMAFAGVAAGAVTQVGTWRSGVPMFALAMRAWAGSGTHPARASVCSRACCLARRPAAAPLLHSIPHQTTQPVCRCSRAAASFRCSTPQKRWCTLR